MRSQDCLLYPQSNYPLQQQSVSYTLCAILRSRGIKAFVCLLQERLASLPEGFLPLQGPSQPFPDSFQMHSLERQSLERQGLGRQGHDWQGLERQSSEWQGLEKQSLGRQLAQAEAALKAEQLQCDALREQARQSQGCAIQAQVQLRRSHSRAERLAALVNEADQARRGYDGFLLFCTTATVQPLGALTLDMLASRAVLISLLIAKQASLSSDQAALAISRDGQASHIVQCCLISQVLHDQ